MNTALVVASPHRFFLTPYFSKIIHFLPPVVTNSVITILDLSFLPVAVRWMVIGNKNSENWVSSENSSLAIELTAILSMLIVTLVIMTETTANLLAVGEILEPKLILNGLQMAYKQIGDQMLQHQFLAHLCKVLSHKMVD